VSGRCERHAKDADDLDDEATITNIASQCQALQRQAFLNSALRNEETDHAALRSIRQIDIEQPNKLVLGGHCQAFGNQALIAFGIISTFDSADLSWSQPVNVRNAAAIPLDPGGYGGAVGQHIVAPPGKAGRRYRKS
jgi:hypothetical protein